ncbi:unnamed protein product [Protopolystoma xenopodis]|uniref:Uncharacterized protein n=1 Tax=Protopolystoma xenopodis TaxID=117903 RepID=A0A448X3H3_9PLAT|nr:unnamed protein product [Protopolystoma xenopodis]
MVDMVTQQFDGESVHCLDVASRQLTHREHAQTRRCVAVGRRRRAGQTRPAATGAGDEADVAATRRVEAERADSVEWSGQVDASRRRGSTRPSRRRRDSREPRLEGRRRSSSRGKLGLWARFKSGAIDAPTTADATRECLVGQLPQSLSTAVEIGCAFYFPFRNGASMMLMR